MTSSALDDLIRWYSRLIMKNLYIPMARRYNELEYYHDRISRRPYLKIY